MNNTCIFCERSNLEERIVYENDTFYVVATLGQIVGGYTLIIPKVHVPCMGALADHPTVGAPIVSELTQKVCHSLSMEYGRTNRCEQSPITVFEHGIVGQSIEHAHLHIVPSRIDLTPRIHADFPNSKIHRVMGLGDLMRLYHERPLPYLYWSTSGGESMVCWDPPAPLQYLRTSVAETLGKPERSNWRSMNSAVDKTLWTQTVIRLKPYFT